MSRQFPEDGPTSRFTNQQNGAAWLRSRPIWSILKFIERTLMICGYMALVTSVILLVAGDFVRTVPFFALGAVSVYWTWRKLKRLQ